MFVTVCTLIQYSSGAELSQRSMLLKIKSNIPWLVTRGGLNGVVARDRKCHCTVELWKILLLRALVVNEVTPVLFGPVFCQIVDERYMPRVHLRLACMVRWAGGICTTAGLHDSQYAVLHAPTSAFTHQNLLLSDGSKRRSTGAVVPRTHLACNLLIRAIVMAVNKVRPWLVHSRRKYRLLARHEAPEEVQYRVAVGEPPGRHERVRNCGGILGIALILLRLRTGCVCWGGG